MNDFSKIGLPNLTSEKKSPMRPIFRIFLLQINLVISILGIRKLRLREVKTVAQVYRLGAVVADGGMPWDLSLW